MEVDQNSIQWSATLNTWYQLCFGSVTTLLEHKIMT